MSLRGAFSEVVTGVKIETQERFAVKCIAKEAIDGKEEQLESEIAILKRLLLANYQIMQYVCIILNNY